jgi:aspartyl-tRNA(Asn)/glutamyl-tRNA(Gln) amidotransferase subunit A
MHPTELTVSQAAEAIKKKELSSKELVAAFLERTRSVEDKIHSFAEVYEAEALAEAEAADARIAKGESSGPLEGVPLGIKDNLCVEGRPTTCSSRILKGFVAPYNATVIERLRRAGAIFLGRTSMDEFAMGSSTETSCYGVTRNPWDTERVPGGSSGGSAAAVAAREVSAALGSDTGGSIRQPASLCGVAGLKPTYGAVSRYGLVAFASSLDQIGPIARSVRDIALLFDVIGGHDPRDSTSVKEAQRKEASGIDGGMKGLRVGVPKEYFVEGMEGEVKSAVEEAIKQMQAAGAELVEVSLPHTEYATATYYIIATAEASSNLARYDGVQYGYRAPKPADLLDMYERTRSEGFGDEVKRRIMLGTYVLSSGYYDAYYLKAQKVRTLMKNDFEEAFASCDLLATPVSPTAAFKVGEKLDDPLQMYLSDIFTISANLAGVPAISVPCGFSSKGLPIGLQLIGRHFDEGTILRAAYAYECATDWHKRRPPL